MSACKFFEDSLALAEEEGRAAAHAGLTAKDNPHDCEEFAARWARGLQSEAPIVPERRPSYRYFG